MSLVRSVQYSILSFLGLVGLLSGMFLFDVPALSITGLLLILLTSSLALSSVFSEHLKGTGLIFGLILSLSYLMIGGSLVYYLGTVTVFSIFFLLASLPMFAWLVSFRTEAHQSVTDLESPHILDGVLIAIVVIALVSFFVSVSGNASIEPTRSPWLILSPNVLSWLGLAAASLLILAKRAQMKLVIFGSIATLFSLVSVVLIVFPLGYGFDPFLHQATLDHIILNGTITPKPYYYIGQYAIELIVAFTSSIDTHTIDILLIPVLSALLLPAVSAACVWQITKRGVPTALGAAATLLLPLAHFINTTPQGLANLWTLLIFFIALPELITKHRWVPHWVFLLLTIATLLIHPLAGLPVALFVVMVVIATRDDIASTIRRGLLITVSLGGAIMLPLAFSLSGTSGSLGFHPERIASLMPTLFFSTRYQVVGDLFAYIGLNAWLWYIILAAIAGAILWNMRSRRWLLLPLTSALLIVNAIILSVAGDFSFLIDYEQTNYVGRIMLLSLYVILPLAILGIALGIERVIQMKKAVISIAIILIFAIAVVANGYYTYPRQDAYAVSHGFTIGQSDHDTVTSIRSDAQGIPYIVLANQAVSAAAIQDFGFAPYYGEKGDVFYYPVPTGGPMYQIFLGMIEGNPTLDLAVDAMDLANVDRAYFVVNEYWWSSHVAVERAKVETDEWFSVGDGATTVFIFNRPSDAI
ncbi:hypothetical protein HQ524_01205 [Candidatus Uhrbacteria bacterium]|nr:hypothetical protein [Candidatus Uhrbacteria bacterium]